MLSLKKLSKIKKQFILKTTIVAALATSVVAFSSGPIALATSTKLTTIYHVYLNGTYVGNVTDKTAVDQFIAEKVDAAKDTLKDKNVKIGPQVEYIPEQVFHSNTTNEETIQTIESSFQLQAEASAIILEDKPVVYVESAQAADEVMKKLELKYVPEAQLNELEARKAAGNTTLPALKENETRLLDVRLSKKVSVEEENISPDQIMSVDQAVAYLLKGTLEEKKYKVVEGDALETIAHAHGLKTFELLDLNPGLTEDSLLKIGQELNVTALQPFVQVIVEKQVNQVEDIPFTKQVVQDATLPKGTTKVKQEGKNGSRSATYSVTIQNGVTTKKDRTAETILQQPVNAVVIKGTKVIPSRGSGTLSWPTVGGYVSSQMGYRWGKMHKGIDIARPSNKTIKAADNGVVVFASWDSSGYGNKVIIDHKNGMRTLYAHMSSLKVHVGQTVSAGQAIGVMGATGDATGVHLHFEVTKNGSLKNPMSYLRR